jgi:hypothetical protein
MQRNVKHALVILVAAPFALVTSLSAKAAEGDNSNYPDPIVVAEASAKTRAQVTAEFLEARRLGLLPKGDGDAPEATAEQERMIELAGLHAVESETASKKAAE